MSSPVLVELHRPGDALPAAVADFLDGVTLVPWPACERCGQEPSEVIAGADLATSAYLCRPCHRGETP